MAGVAQTIVIDTDDPEPVEGNSNVISLANGDVIVDISAPAKDDKDSKFDDNLALNMSASDLGTLAESLMQGIEADLESRSEWETTRTRGIELLGLKIEEPRSDVSSSSSAPLEGMATVRHPLLCEAVLRGTSNAIGELLPADGPVKIKNVGSETSQADGLAERFEKDFNHYLTDVATEYYPDTKRMLFWTYFGGSGWKKVYSCPIRRRPVSESIDANDIIVSNSATDLWNCGRVTHRITMRPSTMKRMQLLKVYRDVALGQPTPTPNAVQDKKDSVEGVRPQNDRPEDQPFTLYECYCEWILDEFAPPQFKDKALPLPYRVTIDKDSREILEIRRNWKEDDEACLPRKYLVKYPFVEAMGIYGIGLVHILGNATTALTAAWREMLDAGMFANFPGFAYLKSAGRQLTNEFRVPPGGGIPIDSPNGNISQALMPLPYKDITPGLLGLVDKITESSQRLGGTADMPIGEGKQDAPVGTTIALIEQATKIESAVHKGLHKAQAEEFQLIKERFREDPEAFWRHNPAGKTQWSEKSFMAALDSADLIPVADPNTPSHMHRVAKAVAIKQLQAANPELYDARAVDLRVLAMIKVDDAESLFAPPPPPQQAPPDPRLIDAHAKVIAAETGKAKVALESQNAQAKFANDAAERESKEKIATVNLAKELVIHGSDQQQAFQQHGLEQRAQDFAEKQHADTHGLATGQHALGIVQSMADHSLARDQQAHQQDMDIKNFNKPAPKPKEKKS